MTHAVLWPTWASIQCTLFTLESGVKVTDAGSIVGIITGTIATAGAIAGHARVARLGADADAVTIVGAVDTGHRAVGADPALVTDAHTRLNLRVVHTLTTT